MRNCVFNSFLIFFSRSAKPYAPEKGVDLAALYKGKQEVDARWKKHQSSDPHGVVDLNKALGKHKGAVAYAYTAVMSPDERTVDIRLGTMNAVRVFLNGEQVFSFGEYHHGMATLATGEMFGGLDRYASGTWRQDRGK